MIKAIYATLCILILSTGAYAKDDSSQITVATVNGESITKNELDRATNVLAPRTYFHSTLTDKKRKKVEKKALEKLIEKKLLLQYARKNGIKATKKEIEKKEKKIRSSFKNEKSFLYALKRADFTYESFKKELEVDIIMSKFYDKFIKTTYSDEDLKNYYEKNRFKFKEPEKIKARIIYVKNDPTDPKGKEKAEKKIKEAYSKIKAGEKFADIAAKYSDAMSRIKGGEIGYTHRGRLDSVVDEIAFSLNIGEMSDIIENDKGYYLVLVEGKKPPKQISYKDAKEKLRKELIAKAENEKKKEILEKMKKVAKIQR